MVSRNLSGSPWHVEVLKMDEIDDRRHRSRCVHYSKESKYCDQYIGRCIGSAHCPYYEEGYVSNNRSYTKTKITTTKKPKHMTFPKSVHTGKINTVKRAKSASSKHHSNSDRPMNISFNQALKKINK